MAFNFVEFLKSENIFYITHGKNVKDGNVNIKCPFCGAADHSEHMGISIKTGVWGCWRSKAHRGKQPHKLIMALKRCSWDQANAYVDDSDVMVESAGWDELKSRLNSNVAESDQCVSLDDEYAEFRRIKSNGIRGRYARYIKGRGFKSFAQVADVCTKYGLRCALSGKFGGRLIIPFIYNTHVIGWTGRAIGRAELRYVSHPKSSVVKRNVYNYDNATHGGKVLIIVEGPLDAIKVDYFAEGHGYRAVALLGVDPYPTQAAQLVELGALYDSVLILLDKAAESQALQLQALLPISSKLGRLHVKDPGDLAPCDVVPFIESQLF